jgi:hypothetical protein
VPKWFRMVAGGTGNAAQVGMRLATTQFEDEDTDPAPVLTERRRTTGGKDEPRYELVWVHDPRLGMVLRVRRIDR